MDIKMKKQSFLRIRWISGLKKPALNFSAFSFDLPYETLGKYVLGFLLFAIIFLLSGGIYNLTENPLPLGQSPTQLFPIFPSMSEQYIVESVITAFFCSIGALGFFLIWYSTRFAYDPRSSLRLLILGISFVIIAGAVMFIIYDYKIRITELSHSGRILL